MPSKKTTPPPFDDDEFWAFTPETSRSMPPNINIHGEQGIHNWMSLSDSLNISPYERYGRCESQMPAPMIPPWNEEEEMQEINQKNTFPGDMSCIAQASSTRRSVEHVQVETPAAICQGRGWELEGQAGEYPPSHQQQRDTNARRNERPLGEDHLPYPFPPLGNNSRPTATYRTVPDGGERAADEDEKPTTKRARTNEKEKMPMPEQKGNQHYREARTLEKKAPRIVKEGKHKNYWPYRKGNQYDKRPPTDEGSSKGAN